MKTHKTIIATIVILSIAALGSAQPTTESIQELLSLSGSQQMVEMTKGQLSNVVNAQLQQTLQGKSLTPEITKIVQNCSEKASKIVNDGMTWEKIEPMIVQAYQATLSQEEVNGIVAFYKTAAGKAMVEKMPQLMQATTQSLQQQIAPVAQQLQQLQQEAILQLQAEFAKAL